LNVADIANIFVSDVIRCTVTVSLVLWLVASWL